MNPTLANSYLPFIDGLRAVAVLMVVAFHAGFGFPGGFIGVDVFFVISGFLITSLIERDLQNGTFCYQDFWIRRVRRILPASLFVAFLTLCLGAVILLPNDLVRLAESVLATLAMGSNVYFWRHVGYFSTQADSQPLLHMWSLAVEEQFYLLFPVVLAIIHRHVPQHRKSLLILVGAGGSLLFSEWAVRNQTGAAYFLLPSRAWELLIGSLLCYLPAPNLSSKSRNIISQLTLAQILAAACVFSANTTFPGLSALWPCVATAIFIHCNRSQESRVASWLGTPSIVTIGKMSYSIYLVHWPILALMQHCPGLDSETWSIRLLAIVLTAAGSIVLYWFIERPLRTRRVLAHSNRLMKSVATVMLMMSLVSVVVLWFSGFPSRFAPAVTHYAAAGESFSHRAETSFEDLASNRLPELGDRNGSSTCLLWGDSHAMALGPGLDASLKSLGLRGIQATHSETPPLLNFVVTTEYGLDEATPEYASAVVDLIDREKIDFVVMAAMWSKYQSHPEFRERLDDTVRALRSSGAQVAIVHDVAEQHVDVPIRLAQAVRSSESVLDIGVDYETHRVRHAVFANAVSSLENEGITELFPDQHFVDHQGLWRAELDGESMYRDADHLSIEGSLRLKPMFDSWLRQCRPDIDLSLLR